MSASVSLWPCSADSSRRSSAAAASRSTFSCMCSRARRSRSRRASSAVALSTRMLSSYGASSSSRICSCRRWKSLFCMPSARIRSTSSSRRRSSSCSSRFSRMCSRKAAARAPCSSTSRDFVASARSCSRRCTPCSSSKLEHRSRFSARRPATAATAAATSASAPAEEAAPAAVAAAGIASPGAAPASCVPSAAPPSRRPAASAPSIPPPRPARAAAESPVAGDDATRPLARSHDEPEAHTGRARARARVPVTPRPSRASPVAERHAEPPREAGAPPCAEAGGDAADRLAAARRLSLRERREATGDDTRRGGRRQQLDLQNSKSFPQH